MTRGKRKAGQKASETCVRHTESPVVRYQAVKAKINAEIDVLKLSKSRLYLPGLYLEPGWHPILTEQVRVLFLVVAAQHVAWVALENGRSQFFVDKWTHALRGCGAWPPLEECFKCYATPQQALEASSQQRGPLQRSAKVLLRVEAQGRGFYDPAADVWAMGQVKPRAMICQAVKGSTALIKS